MSWENAIRASKLGEGETKMVNIGTKILMIANVEGNYYATEGLCKHMKWPLSWGAKIEDGCVRCPLHQTTHKISDGSLLEWAPFPLFPPFGKLVGSLVSRKDLSVFETRVEEGFVQVSI